MPMPEMPPLFIDLDDDGEEELGPMYDIDADFLNDALVVTLTEEEIPFDLYDQLLPNNEHLIENDLTYIYVTIYYLI